MLLHYFHGAKKNRGYYNRSAMLWDHQFDPAKDLKRDWQGMWQLTDQKIGLRDDLRAYFRSRDEDGQPSDLTDGAASHEKAHAPR